MDTMGVIRSWGEEYDGTGDPAKFISRTEELAEAYGIELDHAAVIILLSNNTANNNTTQRLCLGLVAHPPNPNAIMEYLQKRIPVVLKTRKMQQKALHVGTRWRMS